MASQASPRPDTEETSYPEPLIFPPKGGEHLQTFIILHGRGSNAKAFGPELLISDLPSLGKLQDLYHNAKFLFPNASRRPLARFKGALMQQWFDSWAVDKPQERWELQVEGLRESAEYLHEVIQGEVELVGTKNVVLWGISQGCATSLIASLLWTGEPLGAVVGMCGYLPMAKQMREALASTDDASGPRIDKAVERLREVLQLPPATSSSSISKIPIFFGHGTDDDKVPLHLAHDAERFLRELGVKTRLKEYEGLGHWYVEVMLKHIVEFLVSEAGWVVETPFFSSSVAGNKDGERCTRSRFQER